jgi:hypothetical protein
MKNIESTAAVAAVKPSPVRKEELGSIAPGMTTVRKGDLFGNFPKSEQLSRHIKIDEEYWPAEVTRKLTEYDPSFLSKTAICTGTGLEDIGEIEA